MILVLGGTSESLQICNLLSKKQAAYSVSVTSSYGNQLAQPYFGKVHEGLLDQSGLESLFVLEKIDWVIDATHPYAVEISKNARAACANKGIPYSRYERPSQLQMVNYTGCYLVDDMAKACEKACELGTHVLLTTGSKNLKQWVRLLAGCVVVARVLPTVEALGICEEAGLKAHQIIGMKGPFSTPLNVQILKDYGIHVMITKESGKAGGFLEKIEACQQVGIPIVVVRRPQLACCPGVVSLCELETLLDCYEEKGGVVL